MIKKLLQKQSLLIIFMIIFISLIWVGLFNLKNKPKDEEICYLFISGDIDNEYVEEIILNHSDFKKVIIYECFENDQNYELLLQTSGLINSDILIVTEDLLKANGADTSFCALNTLNDDELSYFYINDLIYGIKLDEHFKNHLRILSNEQNYYLVIKDNSKKNNVIKLLDELITNLKK